MVFKASGPDAPRIPLTVSNWLEARQELENWLLDLVLSYRQHHISSFFLEKSHVPL